MSKIENGPGLASRTASKTADTTVDYNCTPAAFDDPDAQRRRRESAIRLPGDNPDPIQPGRRYHRPATGFRAAGFKDGYASALRSVLSQHAEHIDELLREKLTAVISRSASCQ